MSDSPEARISPELLELVAKVSRSLKIASGQLREIERALALLPQEKAGEPERFSCPHCGPLAGVRSRRRLEEHMQNVHGPTLDQPQVSGSSEGLDKIFGPSG